MAASPTLTVRDTAEVDHAAPSDTDLRRHRPRLMEDPSKQKVPPRQPRVFSTCFNLSGRVNSFNLRPLSPVSSSAVFSNGPSKIPRDVLRPKEPEKGAAAPPPVSRSPSPVPPTPCLPENSIRSRGRTGCDSSSGRRYAILTTSPPTQTGLVNPCLLGTPVRDTDRYDRSDKFIGRIRRLLLHPH